MLRGYKPDWLYESLPYLYFGSGLLMVVVLRNAAGAFSGLMLVSAAITVWRMRRSFRRRLATESATAARGGARRGQRGLGELVGRDGLEQGHLLIDDYHRNLFDRCNTLTESIRTGAPVGDVELALYELLWAFEAHCEAEHKLFACGADPLSDEEVDRYEAMLDNAKALRQRYHDNELPIGELVSFVVNDVVLDHVMGGRTPSGSRVSLKGGHCDGQGHPAICST